MKQLILNFQNDMEATGGMTTSSSQVASLNLANHTVPQENAKAKKTNAIFGRKCLESYEKLSQATSWGKTLLASLVGQGDWFSTRCILIWKLKATKSRPWLYLQRQLMRHTGEIECGLLPTPTSIQRDHPERVEALKQAGAETMMSRINGEARPNSIIDHLHFHGMLPTPTTQEIPHPNAELTKSGRRKSKIGSTHSVNLADLSMRGLLPTPTAMDCTQATADMKSSQVKEGSMHSVTLTRAMTMGMLPTPCARDTQGPQAMEYKKWKGEPHNGMTSVPGVVRELTGSTSQLSPQFVLEMMGFPTNWTELPFLNGERSQSKPQEMP